MKWIFWVMTVLIGLSILGELITGTARARGLANYSRRDKPWGYWSVLVIKALLGAMIAAMAMRKD